VWHLAKHCNAAQSIARQRRAGHGKATKRLYLLYGPKRADNAIRHNARQGIAVQGIAAHGIASQRIAMQSSASQRKAKKRLCLLYEPKRVDNAMRHKVRQGIASQGKELHRSAIQGSVMLSIAPQRRAM